MTGVNPIHTHGLGIWGNERIVAGFRVDKKLYKEFKPAAVDLFGSTCNPLGAFMAGVVGVYKKQRINGVNPQPTISIGEIKIERNLRERRKPPKMVTVEEETETPTEKLIDVTKCIYCKATASDKAKFLPTETVYGLCSQHLVDVAFANRDKWKHLGRAIEVS